MDLCIVTGTVQAPVRYREGDKYKEASLRFNLLKAKLNQKRMIYPCVCSGDMATALAERFRGGEFVMIVGSHVVIRLSARRRRLPGRDRLLIVATEVYFIDRYSNRL